MTQPITKKPRPRYLIVYGMWQKPDMVAWHINNIRRRTNQKLIDVLFIFDTNDPTGIASFDRLSGVDGRNWRKLVFEGPIYEIGVHSQAIDFMMKHGYDCLMVFQDDAGLLHEDIFTDVKRIHDTYGERLGVIGGRDGYSRGLNNIHASHWSRTQHVRHWIAPSVYVEVDLLNTGPWFYYRHVIDKIGKPDPDYGHFHVWEEYCLRCKEAGLQNILLGTNILHEAFGSLASSTLYMDEKQNRKCYNRIMRRWEEYDEKVKNES